jgi:hypothetical protein
VPRPTTTISSNIATDRRRWRRRGVADVRRRIRGADRFDFGDLHVGVEAVAPAGHGVNEGRTGVAQGDAQFVHALRQRVVRDHHAGPDGGHQAILGQHLARPRREEDEKVEGLRPQRNHAAIVQQLAAVDIEGEGTEDETRALWRFRRCTGGRIQRILSHLSARFQDLRVPESDSAHACPRSRSSS